MNNLTKLDQFHRWWIHDGRLLEANNRDLGQEAFMAGFECGSDSVSDASAPSLAPSLLASHERLREALEAVWSFWAGGDAPPEISEQIRAALAACPVESGKGER